jgi:hypothetical protein
LSFRFRRGAACESLGRARLLLVQSKRVGKGFIPYCARLNLRLTRATVPSAAPLAARLLVFVALRKGFFLK